MDITTLLIGNLGFLIIILLILLIFASGNRRQKFPKNSEQRVRADIEKIKEQIYSDE